MRKAAGREGFGSEKGSGSGSGGGEKGSASGGSEKVKAELWTGGKG